MFNLGFWSNVEEYPFFINCYAVFCSHSELEIQSMKFPYVDRGYEYNYSILVSNKGNQQLISSVCNFKIPFFLDIKCLEKHG